MLAIGKLGDKRGSRRWRRCSARRRGRCSRRLRRRFACSAVNCSSHQGYIAETLKFATSNPGFQPLLRSAAGGLAALAVAGNKEVGAAADRAGRAGARSRARRRLRSRSGRSPCATRRCC